MQQQDDRTGQASPGGTPGVSASASEQASQSRQAEREFTTQAHGIGGEMKEQARSAGRAVRNEVTGVAEDVKRFASEQVEASKEGVASRISHVAEAVHEAADRMRQDEAWLAQFVDVGARELDEFAQRIRSRDVSSLYETMEHFARRNPGLFVGASVALGFAAVRFAQSSGRASGRGRSYGSESDYGYEASRPQDAESGWPGQPTPRYPAEPRTTAASTASGGAYPSFGSPSGAYPGERPGTGGEQS